MQGEGGSAVDSREPVGCEDGLEAGSNCNLGFQHDRWDPMLMAHHPWGLTIHRGSPSMRLIIHGGLTSTRLTIHKGLTIHRGSPSMRLIIHGGLTSIGLTIHKGSPSMGAHHPQDSPSMRGSHPRTHHPRGLTIHGELTIHGGLTIHETHHPWETHHP